MEGSTSQVDRARVEMCLRRLIEDADLKQLKDQEDFLQHIGLVFSPAKNEEDEEGMDEDKDKEKNVEKNEDALKKERDAQIERAKYMIRKFVVAHLESWDEKFEFIIHMIQKLLKFVNGDIAQDDQDSLANHECLTPGHVYLQILKSTLQRMLIEIRNRILKDLKGRLRRVVTKKSPRIPKEHIEKILTMPATSSIVTNGVRSFFATGNVPASKSMARVVLPQVSSFIHN
jgi:DNA-directed RNA polymerase beta subunit